ncbi:MAG: ATP-binding protein [Methanobacterium sp. ERen5]|nr:MAG: ATP-binding protein [Methanobacterium sp. ERen5]
MKIGRVKIEGIKSYKRTKFTAENYNILAGENNSGKSNIISAIRWFFKHQSFKLTKEDINTGFKTDPSIIIEFVFEDGDSIPSKFKNEFADRTGKKFLVRAYCNINELKQKPQSPKYQILKFYGKPEDFTLPKLVDIIYVPSIRQLNDELKFTANSTINKLVSKFVIERILEEDEHTKKYSNVKDAVEELSNYINEGEDSPFGELKRSLKKHMLDYGNKELNFTLNPPEPNDLIKNSFEPYVDIEGSKFKLDSQGMGYQRSLIFSLICNMVELESKPSTLLNMYLIEEPELFLHPNHQNHFKNKLMQLSRINNNQLIITSHSPYFLNNIDNYSQVKRISISNNVSNLKEITHEQVSDICKKMEK